MGNHFGGVVERVYLGNLSCRRLLALISLLFPIPNWRQWRLIRANPWLKLSSGLALEKIANFVKILCAFVPLCLCAFVPLCLCAS